MKRMILIFSVMVLNLIPVSSYAVGSRSSLSSDTMLVAQTLLNNRDEVSRVLAEAGVQDKIVINEGSRFEGGNPIFGQVNGVNLTISVCHNELDCDVVGVVTIQSRTLPDNTTSVPQVSFKRSVP